MKKDLLKRIAQKGYDVAYGANLNFSTYDIIKKYPGITAFLSICIGIVSFKWQFFATETVSIIMLIFGIASVYVERFTSDIESYGRLGKIHTDQLNSLKDLYYETKHKNEDDDFSNIEARLNMIVSEYNKESQPNQILFSSWYAHYKLFYEKDVSWMDEELNFEVWKDKIPQSMKFILYVILIHIIFYYSADVLSDLLN